MPNRHSPSNRLQMERDTCHPDTFRDLFFRFAAGLRHFVYFRSGDWAGAEDAVQESFLRLWQNCRAVPPEKARSYLYTVANHLFLDDARRQQVAFRFLQYAGHAPVSHAPGADLEIEARELQDRLEDALARIPEGQRVVFLMNRVEKLTYADIAERLGLSVKAVEKRMHGALIELRKCVE